MLGDEIVDNREESSHVPPLDNVGTADTVSREHESRL
jgi:hypothetical protein